MDFTYLFASYDNLVAKADQAFQRMEGEFADCIRCKPKCSDCCHAVFGLFLAEAAFLKHDFDRLGQEEKQAALQRCEQADRDIKKLEDMLKAFENDPQMRSYSLARARVRCPLLNDNHECVLYPYRPITCRVYGIPTAIQGMARVCGKAGFHKERGYPAFDLDGVQRELYQMSKGLLERMGEKDTERASLLISVSKIIKTPMEELIGAYIGCTDATT
jgi:Fe-S-cluster containining protein